MATKIKQQTDVTVENHGTLYIFRPISDEAREWIEENVDIPSHARWGGGFAVEHRYASYLVYGLIEAGFNVNAGGRQLG